MNEDQARVNELVGDVIPEQSKEEYIKKTNAKRILQQLETK